MFSMEDFDFDSSQDFTVQHPGLPDLPTDEPLSPSPSLSTPSPNSWPRVQKPLWENEEELDQARAEDEFLAAFFSGKPMDFPADTSQNTADTSHNTADTSNNTAHASQNTENTSHNDNSLSLPSQTEFVFKRPSAPLSPATKAEKFRPSVSSSPKSRPPPPNPLGTIELNRPPGLRNSRESLNRRETGPQNSGDPGPQNRRELGLRNSTEPQNRREPGHQNSGELGPQNKREEGPQNRREAGPENSGKPGHQSSLPASSTSTSSMSSLSSPSSGEGVRKRMFPGPAGLLPKLVPGNNRIAYRELSRRRSPPSTAEAEAAATAAAAAAAAATLTTTLSQSQFEDNTRLEECVAWKRALLELDIDPSDPQSLINKYNVSWIRQKAVPGSTKKMPFFLAKIKSIDLTKADPFCVLVDRSGEVAGSLHRDIMDKYGGVVQVGSVMLLKSVVVLVTVKKEYANITCNNLLAVYRPETMCEFSRVSVREMQRVAANLDKIRQEQMKALDTERMSAEPTSNHQTSINPNSTVRNVQSMTVIGQEMPPRSLIGQEMPSFSSIGQNSMRIAARSPIGQNSMRIAARSPIGQNLGTVTPPVDSFNSAVNQRAPGLRTSPNTAGGLVTRPAGHGEGHVTRPASHGQMNSPASRGQMDSPASHGQGLFVRPATSHSHGQMNSPASHGQGQMTSPAANDRPGVRLFAPASNSTLTAAGVRESSAVKRPAAGAGSSPASVSAALNHSSSQTPTDTFKVPTTPASGNMARRFVFKSMRRPSGDQAAHNNSINTQMPDNTLGSNSNVTGSHSQVSGSHSQVSGSHSQVSGSHSQVFSSHSHVSSSHNSSTGNQSVVQTPPQSTGGSSGINRVAWGSSIVSTSDGPTTVPSAGPTSQAISLSAGRNTPTSAGQATLSLAGQAAPSSSGQNKLSLAGQATPSSAGKATPSPYGQNKLSLAGQATPSSAGGLASTSLSGEATPSSAGFRQTLATPVRRGPTASSQALVEALLSDLDDDHLFGLYTNN